MAKLETPPHRERKPTNFSHTYPPPLDVDPSGPGPRSLEGLLAALRSNLCKILDANFYEKALFVKVDVATALW
jgi:hypothetical protein